MQQKSYTGLIIGGVIALIVLILIGTVASSYISAKNFGNRSEIQLDAKYKNNENVLSSGYQQLAGVVQVTEMARDDLEKVFRAAITSREGPEGSKAVVKFVRESNPNLDPALYRKVQQIVEATQKEFQQSQTEFLAQKANYEIALGSFWQGMWLDFAGYPKKNLADYKIISTDAAADAFKTGKQAPMQLRK